MPTQNPYTISLTRKGHYPIRRKSILFKYSQRVGREQTNGDSAVTASKPRTPDWARG
ncbi:hypothetical protein BH10CYA1_BH10CYA1_25850 [soil metagenome]